MNSRAFVVAALSVVALAGTASAQSRVEPNAKVYITPAENGIHTALSGALRKKKVPVIQVTSPEAADYIINVIGEYKKAGWAEKVLLGNRGDANASMTVESREKKEIVFAYNVDKGNATRGIQSVAESCAKHLGKHIEGKE